MKVNIEVFINNVSIKVYQFLITDTLTDVRQKLNIGNSEDYIFLIDNGEIKHNEENQYSIKNYEKAKKIFIKKKLVANPFLANRNKNPVNKKIKKEEPKKNDIKPNINTPKKSKDSKDKTKIEDKKDDQNSKMHQEKKNNSKQEIKEKSEKQKGKTEESKTKLDKKLEEKTNKEANEEKKEDKKEDAKDKINEQKEKTKKEIEGPKDKKEEKLIEKKTEETKKEIKEEQKYEINEKAKDNEEPKDKKKEELIEKKPEKEVGKKETESNNDETEDESNDIIENNYETEDISYEIIENNIQQNIGIEQLITESKDRKTNKEMVKIRKELLQTVNCFIACLGPPGSGKSTFCSNYYKKIYRVKNNYFEPNYFEPSEEYESFTKGIWIVSEAERRKIPIAIKKDLLDVEGFQADVSKCWKYVMIIAFLSTELIILNRDARYDNVKKVLTIIANSLKRMNKGKIPRILKTIYIQTVLKKPKLSIEQMLEKFHIDKNAFNTIKFEYIYLPNISQTELENYNEVIEHPIYKEHLNEVLRRITKTKNYNSVASLIDYIDSFNEAVNGESGFNNQTILKDLELDFNGIYNRHENRLKNQLLQKIPNLKKIERLDETFEDFIKKQEGLDFSFSIEDNEFTFFGACDDFNSFYNNLKKGKNFKIEPKDIFLDVYNTQITELTIIEERKRQEEEQKRIEEERIKREEEERRRREEEDRKREEERKRREEEERKRIEEEDRRREEERKKKKRRRR